uniref:RING-type domain-containing protein n=1 Tax=Anopheles christyi TaxID=43041 RepID=A0A182JXH9_9DIPT
MTADEATTANGGSNGGATGNGAGSGTGTTGTTVPTGTLSLAEPVACAGNNEPLLCSDSAPRDCPVGEQLCVVCHYFPLSRALLPCRHTCICAVCFSKLDRCPMCRATITSYFCIRTEEYLPANSTNEHKVNGKPKGTPAWLKEPPPIVEDTEDLLRAFILEPKIPINEPKPYFEPRHPSVEQLYDIPQAALSTRIVPERCPETGKVLDFIETLLLNAGSTAKNSMSLQREPTESLDSARGSASYFPFWPGGFDEPENVLADLVPNPLFDTDLKSCPPGFATGVEFEAPSRSDGSRLEDSGKGGVIDLLSAIATDDGFDLLSDRMQTQTSDEKGRHEETKPLPEGIDDETLLAVESERGTEGEVLKISNVINNALQTAEWAEMLDISKPVDDFYVKIPVMAHRFPFELDIFQKQAILKLEEHSHVFVAAHTSAGKTVVAEYAIALSKKHMTKTIYTSPIKALSNQKYRDFKTTFQDVGLITGDIQIDPTASCLIMTTEILRSMLYCGSDITRDLEYVIFDEVHYITDSDRGYVWEEVLILLPDHVCIVMLSATVPNTIEFANWVGKTKKKRVWVVSTAKRPVPLEHYLYTGFGGKSKDDSFLIVNEQSQFVQDGYRRAKESYDAKQAKNTARWNGPYSQRQEQTLWVGLIDHLRKKEKLPVVSFTLSRNRCDNNAEALVSCDLTTAREKYAITSFFQQCLQRLVPADRVLPQVQQIQSCLERGIGIHHSGILPILKEIVEMLFARGLVKILFATETFAMGVNMPARTVIFDSTRKFDGQAFRPLQPSEYTQMAGRAGRRGLDKTGTVIILCKQILPTDGELKTMILGKPVRLESQFRLTYAMMLYLLRVELVSVENMMLHSFREFDKRQQMPQSKLELSKVQEKVSDLSKLSDHLQPLCEFYESANDYLLLRNELLPKQLCQPKAINELKVGRVVVVTDEHHYNKLGILLSFSVQSHKDLKLVVLVLDHHGDGKAQHAPSDTLNRGTLWHQMLSLALPYQTFLPEGVGGHAVLTLAPVNLVELTKHSIKCDANSIIRSWQNRLIPRFRDAPPSQTTIEAIAALAELNASVVQTGSVSGTLELVRFQRDLTNLELTEQLKVAQDRLNRWLPYTNIADFEHEFALVYDRKQLERKLDELKYQASYESLSLYPDYCRKLQVLQELKYIDDMQQVAMKGRVACEMGQNELMITELVMRNILTVLQPAEIAALLSSLVFQAKSDVKPKLTETLQKGEAQFREVENDIRLVERQYGVTDVCKKEELNFALTEVVYEWARNKPFAEIMLLTDIKEGIIVRCIQQLNETLCNVKEAARIIGDPVLHSKMEEASNAIKRDIVFAASLYTSNTPIVIGEV